MRVVSCRGWLRAGVVAFCLAPGLVAPMEKALAGQDDALAATARLGALFADRLAVSGGFAWAYSADLAVRRGEGGPIESLAVWNQPPGTPAIGGAFLLLSELDGDARWRRAADAAAQALVRGQLVSGGWHNFTETEPDRRAAWCYRSDGVDARACGAIRDNRRRNAGTLDDNISQSALGFLLWIDSMSETPNPEIREAIDYGLAQIVASQFPNGAWSSFLDRDGDRRRFWAAWRASLPETWSREWVKPDTPPYFIINDHLMRNTIRLLLTAESMRDDPALLAAAVRAGEFLLAAQLPGDSRAWAQTYDADLTPVWGRRFEPPAAASRETAGAMEALARLYLRTGKRRYLDGALEAAAWLRRVRRPEGDWARFYELGLDRPLFVRADDTLSNTPEDLREGYAQIGEFGIGAALDFVDRVAAGERPVDVHPFAWIFEPRADHPPAEALRIVAETADAEGLVVEDGWIRSRTFVDAVIALAWGKAQ